MARTDRSRRRPTSVGVLAVTLCVSLSSLVVALGSCRQNSSRQTEDREVNMKRVVIPIDGMSCSACAARVKKALAAIDGVAEVEVRLADRNARVRFAPSKLSADRLASAVKGLGYQAGAPAEVP